MNRSSSQKWLGCLSFGAALVTWSGVAAAAPLLAVDVSDRTNADGATGSSGQQPGYQLYLMGAAGSGASSTDTNGVTQVLGGYSVNVAPILVYSNGGGSGTMDDRDRNFSLPPGATTTLTEVYDDFVFNSSNTGGLRLQISGGSLIANTVYNIAIYTYDHGSPAAPNNNPPVVRRTANWVDRNNNDALVLTTDFIGGEVPANDAANRFTGSATTNANGMLTLVGINTTALNPTTGLPSSIGVFLNGFEVSAVPEPTSLAAIAGALGLAAARRRRGR